MRTFVSKILYCILLIGLFVANSWAQDSLLEHEIKIKKDILTTMPDNDAKIYNLTHLAYLQINHNVDSTKKYVLIALDLSKKLGLNYYIADCNRLLGWYYSAKGEPDSARRCYNRALEIFDSLGCKNCVASTLISMSELSEDNRQIIDAIDFAVSAVEYAKESNDSANLAMAYHRLGEIYNWTGSRMAASECIKMSLEINCSRHDTIRIANNLAELSNSFYSFPGATTHDLQMSAWWITMAIDLFRKKCDYYDGALLCNRLSNLYIRIAQSVDSVALRQNCLDSAFAYCKMGKNICDKIGQPCQKFLFDVIFAKYYVLVGNTKRAVDIVDSLTSLSGIRPDLMEQIPPVQLLIYKAQKRYKEAFYIHKQIQFLLNKKAISEFDVKMAYEGSHKEFVAKLQKMKEEKEFLAQIVEERRLLVFKSVRALCTIVVALLLIEVIFWLYHRRVNELLCRQKKSIQNQNEVLSLQSAKILSLHDEIERQTEEITRQTKQLFAAYVHIDNNLKTARSFQQYLMPSAKKMKKMFGPILIFWRPLFWVSGDFYWCAEVCRHKIIVAADCTGHGVSGAMMSMLGISSLNNIVSQMVGNKSIMSASDILMTLTQQIESVTYNPNNDKYEGNVCESMDLALCIISPDRKKMQFAGAKRPLWLFRNNELTIIKGDSYTVSHKILARGTTFTNNVVHLEHGDTVYLFSDGITDQLCDASTHGRRKKFQTVMLKKILQENYTKDFDIQNDIICNTLAEWMGIGEPQTDDMLILGFRP